MSPPPRIDGAFRRQVYRIVRLIPYGRVASYGFVSILAGAPRHARQVGWALHTLPDNLAWGAEADRRRRAPAGAPSEGAAPAAAAPTDPDREHRLGRVPWHRVINAKGQVSTHPDEYGTYRQIELLREEGIAVSPDGLLVAGLDAHRWVPEPHVVDALELPAEVLFALDRLLSK